MRRAYGTLLFAVISLSFALLLCELGVRYRSKAWPFEKNLYAYYNDYPDQGRFFTPNNLALSAARFRQLGGFNSSFTLAADDFIH
jgi:hypothetical protein